MPTVLVPLATGFEEIEAISIIDVLRRADIQVIIASLDDTLAVIGAHQITVMAERTMAGLTANDIDMIVLPGGMGGTQQLVADNNVQTLLKSMDAQGKTIAAICAAPLALFKAGVLKPGFTCYPSIEQQIDVAGFRDDTAVVISQNVMTSRGPATAITFALAIVQHLVGEARYQSLSQDLLV